MGSLGFPGHIGGWGSWHRPEERESERTSPGPWQRAPGRGAFGGLPGLGQCISPLPRLPRGIYPHPSEMPTELRIKPALHGEDACPLTIPPLPFFNLVTCHILIMYTSYPTQHRSLRIRVPFPPWQRRGLGDGRLPGALIQSMTRAQPLRGAGVTCRAGRGREPGQRARQDPHPVRSPFCLSPATHSTPLASVAWGASKAGV